MVKYTIWHDNDFDFALWVYENSCLKNYNNIQIRSIPKSNSEELIKKSFKEKNDFYIMCAIKYATPDIIIQKSDENGTKIVFCSEFMTQTPQHDHVFQRFERIFCVSKLGIPVAFVFPGKKCKLEKGSTNTDYKKTFYKVNPLAVHTYLKTCKINKNPTLMFFRPDYDGYLKYDSKHQTSPKIEGDIVKRFNFLNYCVKNDGICSLETLIIKDQISTLNNNFPLKTGKLFRNITYETFIKNYEEYYNLDRVKIIRTEEAIDKFGLNKNLLHNNFLNNDKTLIFSYDSQKVRTTPYCGFLCGYYNLFCLDDNGNKKINFIHNPNYKTYNGDFLNIKEEISECPFQTFENFNNTTYNQILNHKCIFYESQYNRILSNIPDINIIGKEVFYN